MDKPIDPEVIDLNTAMFQHRLKLGGVLARAEISPSTWFRWAQGSTPKVDTLRRVKAAVESMIAEQETAHGAQGRQ
jgi:hypothetical protein